MIIKDRGVIVFVLLLVFLLLTENYLAAMAITIGLLIAIVIDIAFL